MNIRKRSFTKRVVRHSNRLPREKDHSMKPSSIQEVFGQCSQQYGFIFEWSCVELELDSMILVCPFQLEILYDFKKINKLFFNRSDQNCT